MKPLRVVSTYTLRSCASKILFATSNRRSRGRDTFFLEEAEALPEESEFLEISSTYPYL
jgi:hypothetical protein